MKLTTTPVMRTRKCNVYSFSNPLYLDMAGTTIAPTKSEARANTKNQFGHIPKHTKLTKVGEANVLMQVNVVKEVVRPEEVK